MSLSRKRYSLPLVLVLALLCVSGSRKPKAYISFHVEVESVEAAVDEPQRFIIPLTLGNPPRTYFFKKVPEITSRQIESFYPFPSRSGTGFGAAFKLDKQGQNRFASLSALNSGKRLLTSVNTRPVNFVIIDQAINHGYIVVWSGLTIEDIKLFREDMNEIVPATEVVVDEEWGTVDEVETDIEIKKEKRGLFGGLFKGGKKKPKGDDSLPEDAGPGDFAPIPQ